MAFRWRCPFCNHNATITDANFATSRFEFSHGNKYHYQAIVSQVVTCPNPDCREYSLSATLHDHRAKGNSWEDLPAKQKWQLIPAASTKVFPSYVPAAILVDYKESCLIRDLSPKASATLSRRCIQGMIRDFWGVKERRLVDEIEAISEKVDPTTWSAIDAVRKIGNIGAHMEKDIDLIVDVDPDEAQLLISLVETLIQDWYVARHERQQRMDSIISLASTKEAARKQGAASGGDG